MKTVVVTGALLLVVSGSAHAQSYALPEPVVTPAVTLLPEQFELPEAKPEPEEKPVPNQAPPDTTQTPQEDDANTITITGRPKPVVNRFSEEPEDPYAMKKLLERGTIAVARLGDDTMELDFKKGRLRWRHPVTDWKHPFRNGEQK